jgi:hypothetical protein
VSTETSKATQTWWRVSTYFDMGKIEAHEVVKETGKFVTYLKPSGYEGEDMPRREGKDTEYYTWLPTEASAVAYAREILTKLRDNFRVRLASAETALSTFNAAHPIVTD